MEQFITDTINIILNPQSYSLLAIITAYFISSIGIVCSLIIIGISLLLTYLIGVGIYKHPKIIITMLLIFFPAIFIIICCIISLIEMIILKMGIMLFIALLISIILTIFFMAKLINDKNNK